MPNKELDGLYSHQILGCQVQDSGVGGAYGIYGGNSYRVSKRKCEGMTPLRKY